MGQYYHPISLDKREYLSSHDYDNGLKLMEHSWIGNDFVETVMDLLKKGGSWYKNAIVWLGDYADEDLNKEMDEKMQVIRPDTRKKGTIYKFLVNHTKKEFVDLSKTKASEDDWYIHPLPLLTCEGNGQGGGDYRGEDEDNELIGKWSRDVISVEDEKPTEYKEIIFDLVEEL